VLPAFTRAGLTVEAQGYTGQTPYVRVGNGAIIALSLLILGAAWRSTRRQALRT